VVISELDTWFEWCHADDTEARLVLLSEGRVYIIQSRYRSATLNSCQHIHGSLFLRPVNSQVLHNLRQACGQTIHASISRQTHLFSQSQQQSPGTCSCICVHNGTLCLILDCALLALVCLNRNAYIGH
jgi:hypothetical protein